MRFLALLLLFALGSPVVALAEEAPAPAAASPPTASQRPSLAPEMFARWHRGRVLYGVGSALGLLGTGLTLSSVVMVAITGYPCNPSDPLHALNPSDSCNPASASFKPPKPTDAAPLLAYIGSSTSVLGFVFSATGLGYQHHLLDGMGEDSGRGLFAAGTTFGLLGFVGVGASYFFGLTNYLQPHDQGIAILASSITGMLLCTVGSVLYTADEARLKKVWERLSTF